MNKIHLASIRFDYEEKERIQQWWKDNIPVPLGFGAYIHCDHVTLAYKPDDEQAQLLEKLEGVEVLFHAQGWAADEKGQALAGELCWQSDAAPSLWPRRWHVTVATNEGVPPVYSNELLARVWHVWDIHRDLSPTFGGKVSIMYSSKKGEAVA